MDRLKLIVGVSGASGVIMGLRLLETLRRKGYYGLDVDFEFLGAENAALYAAFLSRLREALNAAGYPVMAA